MVGVPGYLFKGIIFGNLWFKVPIFKPVKKVSLSCVTPSTFSGLGSCSLPVLKDTFATPDSLLIDYIDPLCSSQ